MIHSKHFQQCLGFTFGTITIGLVFRYRNRILNYFRQDKKVNVDQDQTRPNTNEKIEKKLRNYTWAIYSGSQSLNWIRNSLLPVIGYERVAIDESFGIPGKYRSDNILEIAEKSERIIIVLGPETSENIWLGYQIQVALQRDREKIWVCQLEPTVGRNVMPDLKIKCINQITPSQIDQVRQIPGCETEFYYDLLVVYSGPQSLEWIHNTLEPIVGEQLNKRVAIDTHSHIPGKSKLQNILDITRRCEKVIIVLSPEASQKELLRYEIEVALLKGPQNMLVVQLEQTGEPYASQNHKLRCLEPINKIQIQQMSPSDAFCTS